MQTRVWLVCVLVSGCGVVKVDIPHTEKQLAMSAASRDGGGCEANGLLFETNVEVAQLRQREAGFGACITSIGSITLSSSLDALEAGTGCNGPSGTVADLRMQLQYVEQSGVKFVDIVCQDAKIDLSSRTVVADAINACLAKVSEHRDDFIAALNTLDRSLVVRAYATCSANACFHIDASFDVSVDKVEATNCL